MSNDAFSILEIDFARHHQDREYTLEQAKNALLKYIELGLGLHVAENVAIQHKSDDNHTVEFHCINAGSGADLTKAINDFLKSVSDQYARAVTYYDNPRINDLANYSYYPCTVIQIDGGLDRTYEMSFNLRGL